MIRLTGILLGVLVVCAVVAHAVYARHGRSLVSFSTLHFVGYLLHIGLPEALIPYYVAEGHSGILVAMTAVATAMVAQVLNYLAGRLVGVETTRGLIGQRRYERAQEHIDRYGALAVFVFNVIPLTSSLLSLVAGVVRFSFVRLLTWSFLGLAIKCAFLAFAWDTLVE